MPHVLGMQLGGHGKGAAKVLVVREVERVAVVEQLARAGGGAAEDVEPRQVQQAVLR